MSDLEVVYLERNNLIGDFAKLCDLPNFLPPSDPMEMQLVADCLAAEVTCHCCTQCCGDLQTQPCNDDTYNSLLDDILIRRYDGESYKIADLSFLVDKSILN
jgi:hypothetical protein